MDSKHNYVRRESKTMERARDMLKMDLIKEEIRGAAGAVVEIVSYPNGDPGGYYWVNGEAFHRGDAPIGFDLNDMKNGQPWLGDIETALWLFGPSQVKEPGVVYRWVHSRMSPDAAFYVANEIPWRGKSPQMQDYVNYTDEEIHASLVRGGFENISHSDEGPYFRLWKASRSSSIHPELFYKVESHLSAGKWRTAVEALGELDDKLDSLPAVREYALLLAACHDLAGNTSQSYAALTEALRIDPQCGRAMCGLGRLAAIKQDFEGALLFFESALKRSPSLVAALEGHALVCELMGDLQSAYEDMVDASNFRPRDEDLMFDVIRLGNRLGYQDEVASFITTRNTTTMSWDASTQAIATKSETTRFQISC